MFVGSNPQPLVTGKYTTHYAKSVAKSSEVQIKVKKLDVAAVCGL
jgi:hypothetical protein